MRAIIIFLIACLLAAGAPLLRSASEDRRSTLPFPGWPVQFEGQQLRELPRSEREQRFERDFPGRIGRFTDGRREIIIRWVTAETRTLHPAADCFRGLGYAVEPGPIFLDASNSRWGTFTAVKGDERLHVREMIRDDAGGCWSDASSWYWAAALHRTNSPWWAITVAER